MSANLNAHILGLISNELFLYHEGQINVKYLPNVNLGVNVVADPNLENTGNSSILLIIQRISKSFSLLFGYIHVHISLFLISFILRLSCDRC